MSRLSYYRKEISYSMKKTTTPGKEPRKPRRTPAKKPVANNTTPVSAPQDDVKAPVSAPMTPDPADKEIIAPGGMAPITFSSDVFSDTLEHTSAQLENIINEINTAKNLAKARFGKNKDTPSYELVAAMNYLATTGRRFKRALDAAESVVNRHGI